VNYSRGYNILLGMGVSKVELPIKKELIEVNLNEKEKLPEIKYF